MYRVALAAVLALSATTVEARPRHVAALHHHVHARRGASGQTRVQAGARYGTEPPADASYQGPGAEVFRQTILSAHAPGTTLELDPYAKQSATGGPSGGLPNNGSGP